LGPICGVSMRQIGGVDAPTTISKAEQEMQPYESNMNVNCKARLTGDILKVSEIACRSLVSMV